MGMHSIEIEYPDELLSSIDENSLKSLAREALYLRLYEQGLLSSGRAAQLLGITRWNFLDLLGKHGISYFDEQIDIEDELGRAKP